VTRAVIVHTTDLSGDDTAAFVHAAALAAANPARLVTLHGNAGPDQVARLPDAAELGRRWHRAIEHDRICHECCDDVTDTLLDALRGLEPDLVVTGSHARHGLAALLHGSVSEALARNLDAPTLIVPNHGRGFADEATGAIDLRTVVVPAADAITLAAGLAAARRLCDLAGARDAEIVVVHVGDHDLALPVAAGAGIRSVHARGNVRDAILATARDEGARVIVMPTRGHDGALDVLAGSRTEQVMHAAGCPVLVVPVIPGSR